MYKPLRCLFFAIMTGAEKPIAPACFVFHGIVVAVGALVQPPFALDAFGAVRFCYLMQLALVTEEHGWVIGYRRRHLDKFRFGEQVDGSGPVGSPGRGRLLP